MSEETLQRLAAEGVEFLRVVYPDLHGICRGKDVPLAEVGRIEHHGIAMTEAIMTVDLRHNVVAGFEHGFRDICAVPLVEGATRLPWDPCVAWCLGEYRELDGRPLELDPRGPVRRAVEGLAARGLAPIAASELEFYLAHPGSWAPYTPHDSSVYTVGEIADPQRVVRQILTATRDVGLVPLAASQEYGRGQYEINLAHTHAVEAADRGFLFKALTKQVAARNGLLATFMGRFADDEGSGFHVHVSLQAPDGRNAFDDPSSPDGLSDAARAFAAGVLAHARALQAFLCPTVNAYRRLQVESLAPTHVNWGLDNRLAMLRFPAERGAAARLEVRSGDGAASAHLALGAILLAGLDGLERGLELPEPVTGNPYELPADVLGPPLPGSLDESLDALAADGVLWQAMGPRLCETFTVVKRFELERWHAELARITQWEREEYAHHL